MSKRSKHESGGSHGSGGGGSHSGSKSEHRASLVEQKLHELQTFTYDLLVKNNGRKEGTVRSTRAFADPLLNTEIRLLRQREGELSQRVADLEKSKHVPTHADEMRRLHVENDELRRQLGELGLQTRLQQLDAKDRALERLVLALAEAKREAAELEKQNNALSTQVFLLQKQLKSKATANHAHEDFDSFFNDDVKVDQMEEEQE